jgi:hypothetical protein
VINAIRPVSGRSPVAATGHHPWGASSTDDGSSERVRSVPCGSRPDLMVVCY